MQIYSCARRIIDTNIIDYSDCRATDYTAHALVTEDRKGNMQQGGRWVRQPEGPCRRERERGTGKNNAHAV